MRRLITDNDTCAPGSPEEMIAFLQAIDASPRPLLLLDAGPDRRIVDANAAWCEATGRERSTLVGLPVAEAFRAPAGDPALEAVQAFHATLDAAAASGVPHADMPRPHGEAWWRVLATPLIDTEGRLTFLLAESEEVAAEATA